MSLTLTVLSFKNKPITEIPVVSIGDQGGSIGRSNGNTLVLPDAEKFVSRHHASISFENNKYYLSDSSLSGVYVNGADKPLNNSSVCLENGTQLRIGEYEIAVSIADDPILNDFTYPSDPVIAHADEFLVVDKPWFDLDPVERDNSLMADNFPRHEELVQSDDVIYSRGFESALPANHAPIFDNYIAPNIIAPIAAPVNGQIPENLSFDDFFSGTEPEPDKSNKKLQHPAVNNDDFEDFFGAAISDMLAERQSTLINKVSTEYNDGPHESVANSSVTEAQAESSDALNSLKDFFVDNKPEIGSSSLASLESDLDKPAVISEVDAFLEDDYVKTESTLVDEKANKNTTSIIASDSLFKAFLQGAAVECKEINAEQQTETLDRVGRMFRKLIEGTVAVLRSRAEFKSLCRVNMTVIKPINNNPLKFTVSTDHVLRLLIENKTDGFLSSTTAIQEAFDDIMNHQLATQAGIQASLIDLLATFDPKNIEKKFEQGLVLQKKSKCWDSYADTYRETVENAVEDFFGEAFVKAYEQQMSILVKTRGKQQDK
ncbi:MAG: type VI secretion system-associated FHA domain protein TagH [Methylococcales bacterium]